MGIKVPEIFSTQVIDKIIFGCVMIFLLSLNNSIFVNQLGYFLALIFIFIRYFKTNENQFPKTGLEGFFILFFLVELVAANVSEYKPNAMENLVKRMLQIPIVYVVMIGATDLKRAKLFAKTYMFAALLTICVYMVFAYEHFIHHLYSLESRGPSPFQYVMTAGGLMMFTTIFFFAFFLNEAKWDKKKIYYLAGFIISFLAITASYTRAAWIGTFVGITAILIFKRKWWMLGAIAVLIAAAVFLSSDVSKVYIYSLENGKMVKNSEITTDGKVMGIYADSNQVIVADYQKGIKAYKGEKLVSKTEMPRPVWDILKYDDKNYIASLIDSRFIILDGSDNFRTVKTFVSPGQTITYNIANKYFYVFDKDSGLTVFRSLDNLKDTARFSFARDVKSRFVSNNFLAYYTYGSDFVVYSLKNSLPDKLIYSEKINSTLGDLYGDNSNILFSTEGSLKSFSIKNDSVKYISENKELKSIVQYHSAGNKLFMLDLSANMYSVQYPLESTLQVKDKVKLDFVPNSMQITGSSFFFGFEKHNRLRTIVDPYWMTNIQRIDQFQTAMRIFKAHPFGIGDIGVEHAYAKYKAEYEKENFGHLHNNYTQFLVIFGFLGFIFMIWMLVKFFKIHLKIALELRNVPFVSAYALAAFASFIGFLFAGIAEWNFGDHEIITMVYFTLGLNLAFYKLYQPENKKE